MTAKYKWVPNIPLNKIQDVPDEWGGEAAQIMKAKYRRFTNLTLNEELDKVTDEGSVGAALLALGGLEVLGGLVVSLKQLGVEELTSRLRHLAVGGVNQLVDILTVLV